MVLGFDFDGVIARQVRCRVRLPDWLFVWLLALAVEMPDLEVLRWMVRGHRIVIVTARPAECEGVTRLWLRLHRVRFDSLRCVGAAGDKVPVLLEERVDAYFDDKLRHVSAADRRGVAAHLFESWNQVQKEVDRLGGGLGGSRKGEG